MKNLTIGIDVDGVLRDNLGEMVRLYNESFNENLTVDDVTDYKTEKIFPKIMEVTGDTSSHWFFQTHSKELFSDAKPFKNVTEDIKRLQEHAQVVIITYQKSYLNKAQTLEWLEKCGIEPDGIVFIKDKTLVHCDYLVDDNDWNFIGSHVKTGVLIDAPYNLGKDLSELKKQTHCKRMVRAKDLHGFTEWFLATDVK